MPKITVTFHNHPDKVNEINVDEGTTILEAMMESHIELQHNCGGVCACSTCHVIVKKGEDNLSKMTDEEEEQLDEATGLTIHSRLGCQTIIYGDASIHIPDQSIYLERAENEIRALAKSGANIICLQELFTTPYFCQTEDYAPFEYAESLTVEADIISRFSKIAKSLNVVLILPLFEKRARGVYHNSAAVVNADGSFLGLYRKMHIPDDPGFYEKFYFSQGDLGFKVFKTKYATIGVLICWDQWFPEAARITALLGADIIFYPTAIGWANAEASNEVRQNQLDAWLTIQKSHAIANGVFVVSVNRVGIEKNINFWGHTFVCNPFGKLIKSCTANEEHLITELHLKELDFFRQHWPFFRDRRIESYKDIEKRFA
ncbi:hypothetical protein CHS0354_000705 [Potamilus streckersoni]|uniref:Carbon-nitrogen hydrolase n=1 Tax=Potamilus streckersoni TaxID=2493646 RepID=A0AAE0W8I8_9BIVA|nr:hypothetical protein CHS0354_000705 [Potamilus streckersoni]